MKKTSKQLANSLDFRSEVELYFYLVDCYFNGNIAGSKRLFNELKKEDKKHFIFWLTIEYNGTDVFNHYFNEL